MAAFTNGLVRIRAGDVVDIGFSGPESEPVAAVSVTTAESRSGSGTGRAVGSLLAIGHGGRIQEAGFGVTGQIILPDIVNMAGWCRIIIEVAVDTVNAFSCIVVVRRDIVRGGGVQTGHRIVVLACYSAPVVTTDKSACVTVDAVHHRRAGPESAPQC